jgi:arylsulfatase A-like enzyme
MTRYHPTGAVTERRVTPERLLADEVVTLAENLQGADYATFCRINNVQAGHFFNIPQGFDEGLTNHRMSTSQIVADFSVWLNSLDSNRPFFAFLLTRDTHFVHNPRYEFYRQFNRGDATLSENDYQRYPFEFYRKVRQLVPSGVPSEMQERYVDLYDAELAQLDQDLSALQTVLRKAGRGSDTVVVITGDHGERFFETGQMSHSGRPDEAVVRVPLIFFGSGVADGLRIKQVVRSIDIYPTLAEMAGAQPPELVQGRSLLPLIRGERESLPATTAFASFRRAGKRDRFIHMVRDEKYKFYSTGELFNTSFDLLESQNRARLEPQVAERLRRQLDRWLHEEKTLRGLLEEGTTRYLSEEMIEQLRSLGYMD